MRVGQTCSVNTVRYKVGRKEVKKCKVLISTVHNISCIENHSSRSFPLVPRKLQKPALEKKLQGTSYVVLQTGSSTERIRSSVPDKVVALPR